MATHADTAKSSPAEAAKSSPAEAAQVAQETMRRYLDESVTLGRTYLGVWTATAQANLRATFDLQNVALQVSRGLFDSAVQANRVWLDQAADSLCKGQDATAKVITASLGLVESALPNGRA